ncbi:MAG: hypothetical protein KC519_21305 [Anaerolineae bacterium]|nr:hypothetical protein [Anaerolineae bacterium]
MSLDQIGLWAGVVFTLMIFSYLLGDNFLYRLAIYIFAGVAAGFVFIVALQSAILPWLRTTILAPNLGIAERAFGLVPVIFGALLLLKISPRFGRLGNLALAFIIGVGTAVAVVGAVSGTLIPLANATADSITDDTLSAVIVLIGVIATLVYFMYVARRVPGQLATTGRRGLLVQVISVVGKGFIVVTLSALYAGALLSSLTIFSERVAAVIARITGG